MPQYVTFFVPCSMCDSLCLNTVRRTCQGGFTDQSWWRTLQGSDLSGAFANAYWNSFLWLKSQKFSMDFWALCRHASGYTVTSYGPETMCKNNHLKQTQVHINIPSYHMKMSSIWYKSYVNVMSTLWLVAPDMMLLEVGRWNTNHKHHRT